MQLEIIILREVSLKYKDILRFPCIQREISIENQPAAQPDLSMATKPGHMSLVIGPQWLCIITPFEFPILLLFSPLKQGLGISREKEIQWCVKQRKNE